jgi:membrane-associated phospholipid phosphatase
MCNGYWFKSAVVVACITSTGASAQVVASRDRFGDAMALLLPAAAVALTLQHDDTEGLKQLGYSAGLTLGSTELLKYGVNSSRPDGSAHGFPSGHTSIAFVSAAYVHQRYGFETALPMYALATLTGYSRVRTHHHFAKDVVGGALVGIGSAFVFTHPIGARSFASLGYSGDQILVSYSTSW